MEQIIPEPPKKPEIRPDEIVLNNVKEELIALIYRLRDEGFSYGDLEKKTKISRSVIYKIHHRLWVPQRHPEIMISIYDKLIEVWRKCKKQQ